MDTDSRQTDRWVEGKYGEKKKEHTMGGNMRVDGHVSWCELKNSRQADRLATRQTDNGTNGRADKPIDESVQHLSRLKYE